VLARESVSIRRLHGVDGTDLADDDARRSRSPRGAIAIVVVVVVIVSVVVVVVVVVVSRLVVDACAC
jgi:uncharacterized membrane protein